MIAGREAEAWLKAAQYLFMRCLLSQMELLYHLSWLPHGDPRRLLLAKLPRRVPLMPMPNGRRAGVDPVPPLRAVLPTPELRELGRVGFEVEIGTILSSLGPPPVTCFN